jgi:hypothetical protein
MTDEQAHPRLGGFRTPLAAGMLSGILAGVASLATWWVVLRFVRPGIVFNYFGIPWTAFLTIPYYALLCCGPAIAHRRWKLAGYAFLWAIGLCVLDIMMLQARIWFVRLGALGPATNLDPAWVARAAVWGAFIGLVLTWLYGYTPYTALAPLLGAIAGVAFFLCNTMLAPGVASISVRMNTTQELIAARTMFALIGSVVVVLFPTWAIERDLRKRPAPRALDAAAGNG